jgi:hypothetical protein
MKKYMVVEHFKEGCLDLVYERFHAKGRLLPHGLVYLDSWLNKENDICFQLMETDDAALFDVWIKEWEDLTEFEIFPIE